MSNNPTATEPPDERSPFARAQAAISRVLSVALGMILPGFAGYWVDRRIGWFPWLTLLGFMFGLTLGFWRLAYLTAQGSNARQQDK